MAIAEEFAGGSATVHLLDLNGDRAQAEAERLCLAGHRVTAGTVDVTDAASVASAIEGWRAQQGRVDVLCNNAGIARRPQDN
jgi:NAD(P)-dependent dehydrogenase (short-subunit alcohol dehydrogenase family)